MDLKKTECKRGQYVEIRDIATNRAYFGFVASLRPFVVMKDGMTTGFSLNRFERIFPARFLENGVTDSDVSDNTPAAEGIDPAPRSVATAEDVSETIASVTSTDTRKAEVRPMQASKPGKRYAVRAGYTVHPGNATGEAIGYGSTLPVACMRAGAKLADVLKNASPGISVYFEIIEKPSKRTTN